ncbi:MULTISPECIES: hypothetical protein [unclassified Nonomuraea]|uniref:hypothetical protein n=1 Tax=unclassified Nonomuraea TaxID=2593643 RepID=UPI003406B45D
MIRILYWNLSNFSLPKISDPTTVTTTNESAARQSYIVTKVMRGPTGGPIPDLIVVVEVFSRITDVDAEGIALNPSSNAGKAVLRLLGQIRADATLGNGTDWCLVPPINIGGLGRQEAVAVLYNANMLQFTGPNLFYELYGPPGTVVGQSQPVTLATSQKLTPYPAPWLARTATLGRTTTFPGTPQPIAENQLAGEWQYYTAGTVRPIPSPTPPPMPPNRLQFPNDGCRAPFYTRFLDVAGNRTINLFAVHTSPDTARAGVKRMALVPEIAAVNAGEVNVLLGDFNVDTFEPAADAFTALLTGSGGIYTLELDARVAHAGNPVPSRKPYCMTHLLPANAAMPYNDSGVAADPQHNVYPRFGYMGSSYLGISDTGAIDNILTAYGGAGAAANLTVVNTYTGTPYNLFPPAPQGVTAELTGGLPFPSHFPSKMLTRCPPALLGAGGIQPNTGGAAFLEQIFQSWDYAGLPFSTSDHLPLMIDI